MGVIEEIFPESLLKALGGTQRTDEIRLRRGCRVYVRSAGVNRPLNIQLSDAEFDDILHKMCRSSYHSYAEMIREGYIPLGEGYRAGICGKAVCEDGRLINVHPIDSITVRIPHLIRGVCAPVYEIIKNEAFNSSILIYSPPGGGKTTILRDLAMRLAEPPVSRRVCVIDSRREIYIPEMERLTLLSVYSDYPKAHAVQSAIRTMSPDFIISDEIGSPGESQALLICQSAGVSVVASAHAKTCRELLRRDFIRVLHEHRVFGRYCGITRRADAAAFRMDTHLWEEANALGSEDSGACNDLGLGICRSSV